MKGKKSLRKNLKENKIINVRTQKLKVSNDGNVLMSQLSSLLVVERGRKNEGRR